MTHDQHEQRVFEIYSAALAKNGPERQTFLCLACGDDEALRAEVEAVLNAAAEAEGFFTDVFGSEPNRLSDKTSPEEGQPGRYIGPFRILKSLGEGGMARVFLAEQKDPRRLVALKVIKLGRLDEGYLKRFALEQQILARLSHVSIAKIFESGTTREGNPYFAMEHVEGLPITEFCDRSRVPISQRIELFIKVCLGIQHAHQRGIIHRDIKPSNVLVTLQDGVPIPKIIDFGIAKAVSEGDRHHDYPALGTDELPLTRPHTVLGTLDYMSPEQVSLKGTEVDTRTDIYALGVLFYELLVGTLPLGVQEKTRVEWDDAFRIIRRQVPLKPSKKLGEMGDRGSTAADRRKTTVKALSRLVQGDLDWIAMKALEKEKDRRYSTASAFAEDISRHMRHEPVLAGPPSLAYRGWKFCRRHRTAVWAGALLFSTLLAGIVGTTTAMLRAANAEKKARIEADNANTTIGLLQKFLTFPDPAEKGRDAKVIHLLASFEEELTKSPGNNPLIRATLHETLSGTYSGLGLYSEALNHTHRALGIRRQLLGENHPDTIQSLVRLSGLLLEVGEGTEDFLHETLGRAREVLGGNHILTIEAKTNLGTFLVQGGHFHEAAAQYLGILEESQGVLESDHPQILTVKNHLATVLLQQGKYPEASEIYRSLLEIRRVAFGERHPQVANVMNNLAVSLDKQGKYTDAEELYRKTLEVRRETLGEHHPRTLNSMDNLGQVLATLGRFEEAEAIHRRALEGLRLGLGPEHARTLKARDNLGLALQRQGKYGEAVAFYRETLELKRRTLGDDHPETLFSMNHLAVGLEKQGLFEEAERLHRQIIDRRKRVLGEDHPETLLSMNNLGVALLNQGKYENAHSILWQTYQKMRQALSGDNPHLLSNMTNLVTALLKRENYETAIPLARQTVAKKRAVFGENHLETLISLYTLAVGLEKQGYLGEAEALFEENIKKATPLVGESHPLTVNLKKHLATVRSELELQTSNIDHR